MTNNRVLGTIGSRQDEDSGASIFRDLGEPHHLVEGGCGPHLYDAASVPIARVADV